MSSLIICPARHVADLCAERRPSHVLVIGSPGIAPPAFGAPNRLDLVFNDIAEPRAGLVAPDLSAMQALLTFAQSWDGGAPLLVSCEFGISRSTAAAFLIGCARAPHREAEIAAALRRAAPCATPNPLMISLGDALLGREGRMIHAVAAIGRGADYAPYRSCEFALPQPGGAEHGRQPIVLSICTTCRNAEGPPDDRPGERLLAALRDVADADRLPEIALKPVQCLSVCKRPCTAALSSPGRYTYVFGDLDPERDATALLACAQTYAEREHGYLLWRERPDALRRGIVARIPPPGWDGEDGRHPR